MKFLQSWPLPKMTQHVLRVTIVSSRSKIVREYDLMQNKLLSRSDALDRDIFHKTIEKYKKKREKLGLDNWEFSEEDEGKNVGKIFVISDTHFDHEKIIRLCKRPFSSTRQMNQTLLNNWNSVVGEFDKVYFLGDLTFRRGRRPTDYWLSKLNGEIFFIRGNHDSDRITSAKVIPDRYELSYKNKKFLLMHAPQRPLGYDGWIIHGDIHNNNLEEYPLINTENKTINVSSDLTNFTPLSLDQLIPELGL